MLFTDPVFLLRFTYVRNLSRKYEVPKGLNRGKNFNSNKILNLHVGGYTLKYGPLHYYNLHEKL